MERKILLTQTGLLLVISIFNVIGLFKRDVPSSASSIPMVTPVAAPVEAPWKGVDDPGPPWTYFSGDNYQSTYRVRDGDCWVYRTYGIGITRGNSNGAERVGFTGVPLETRVKLLTSEK